MVTAVIVGAGNRGRAVFGRYALDHPQRLRVVALAEPLAERRAWMAREHGLVAGDLFADWRELLAGPRRAELAIVATPDPAHVEPALAALERGYHVLLEKPMALDAASCVRVVEAAERAGRLLQVGHVLRYTPFYAKVAELLDAGAVGRPVHLDLREHVAAWHYTHSFVRGKFRSHAVAAPILLAKACHDLDLIAWFSPSRARRVSSFGGLAHYCAERAPEGAPERCLAGCPHQAACAHDAERAYLAPDDDLARLWPWSDVSLDPSREARRRALETGPYGRCVYHCDNDVADHQSVVLDFDDGATASFGLHGLAAEERRALRVTGTEGELRGVLQEGVLELLRPGCPAERFELRASALGHYGGDAGLLDHLTAVLAGEAPEGLRASGRSALESHLLGFAAERARREGRVVDVDAFRREVGA